MSAIFCNECNTENHFNSSKCEQCKATLSQETTQSMHDEWENDFLYIENAEMKGKIFKLENLEEIDKVKVGIQTTTNDEIVQAIKEEPEFQIEPDFEVDEKEEKVEFHISKHPYQCSECNKCGRREENRGERVRRKVLRDKANILDLPEAVFKSSFRLNKEAFLYILEEINPLIKPTSIPLTHKLAATLRFLSEGSYQRSVGKVFDIGLARSTVSKLLFEVLDALQSKLCSKWIKLQYTLEEEQNAKIHFLEKYGIPGVIGCLDGTHVKIIKPQRECNLFFNRKGYFSINALVICDHKMKIRAIDATRPGSSHDALIWQMSGARRYFVDRYETGQRGTWLLGDAGFGLEPFVMTPFKSSESRTMQSNFNKKHSAARNVVERTIGNLKTRFRCLLNTLNYEPRKACKIINVCSALHNICKEYNLEAELGEQIENEEEQMDANNENDEFGEYLSEARIIRDSIASSLWQ